MLPGNSIKNCGPSATEDGASREEAEVLSLVQRPDFEKGEEQRALSEFKRITERERERERGGWGRD